MGTIGMNECYLSLAGSREHGNETSNSMKGELFEQLSDCHQISFIKFTGSHGDTLKLAVISETLLSL
jgi:hypothetical protein